jgi:hypothetical protein
VGPVDPVAPTSSPSSVISPTKLNAALAEVISVGDIENILPVTGPVLPFGTPFVEPTNMYKNPPRTNTKSPMSML